MNLRIERLEVPGTLISDVALSEPRKPTECVLLLHGYLQSGVSILKRLGPGLPEGARIIAPNGPFPLPRKHEERWKLGFTWYFYDASSDRYFVDMRIALELVAALAARLGKPDLPWRVVGYSQGGYLAPFAALRLRDAGFDVRQVIGVSSRFLEDELPSSLPFRLDAIHGETDDTVDAAAAQASHRALAPRARGGRFHLLSGMGHGIGEPMREALRAAVADDAP